jgi:hypothetical protein
MGGGTAAIFIGESFIVPGDWLALYQDAAGRAYSLPSITATAPKSEGGIVELRAISKTNSESIIVAMESG